MKKILLTILTLCLVFLSGCTNVSEKNDVLNVYNWGELISPEVNKKFTKETGIRVNYTTYQNNEELFAKLSGSSASYDIIFPSEYMAARFIENNMLLPINFENIPNFKYIKDNFKNLDYDSENKYTVPYVWGMVSLLYNKKIVDESEDKITWNLLWNEKYKRKILMFDNARDAFCISMMRLGYSINSNNENEWRRAKDELKKQKPLIQAYVMDQIFDKMENEEAALAPYYAGDAVEIIKNNPNVGVVFPKEGTNRYIDVMCIPKNSKHKDLAEKYINFLCRPDIAAENVNVVGYSTPNNGAFELLDEKTKNNKILYPDNEVIKNSKVFSNLPKKINKLIDEFWIEIKM